eukprot:4425303-Pyramimonas_sp.AAC.1
MVNSQAVEVICRRLYDLFRAFENVKKQSDWKQPRGEGGNAGRARCGGSSQTSTTRSRLIATTGPSQTPTRRFASAWSGRLCSTSTLTRPSPTVAGTAPSRGCLPLQRREGRRQARS